MPDNRDTPARALALRALWSTHPLCYLYAIAHGTWRGDEFHCAKQWSLRELIAFAEALPPDVINRLAAENAEAQS
jgi:hypothetical protein